MRRHSKIDFKKDWPVFSRLNDRKDALQAIKNASMFLMILAGAYTAHLIKGLRFASAGHNFPPGTFILMDLHIAVFLLGGLFLRRINSRVLAVAISFACVQVCMEAIMWISSGHLQSIFSFATLFQFLALWGSIRAVEATFKLRGRFAEKNTTQTS